VLVWCVGLRFELEVKAPFGIRTLLAKEKMKSAFGLIGLARDLGLIEEISFDWVVFRGVPRSIFSPQTLYPVMIRKELLSRERVRRLGLEELLKESAESLAGILGKSGKGEETPLYRDWEVLIGYRSILLDYPVTGIIHVRGGGQQKRLYGDVEVTAYNRDKGIEDFSVLYNLIAKEHGKNEIRKIIGFIENSIHQKDLNVKTAFVQSIDNVVYRKDIDLNELYAIGHRDHKSHLPLIVNYMRNKRKGIIFEKMRYRSVEEDKELKVYKKLSSFINYSTLYNKVAVKHEFRDATIRLYNKLGFIASPGSLIVASTDGSPIGSAYNEYVVNILYAIVESFPDENSFEKWIENGLKTLVTLEF